MKPLLIAFAYALTLMSVLGQGTVTFLTRIGSSVDAPIFNTDGVTPLSGPGYRAQLYAGATAATLQPIGPSVGFRTGLGAGYVESGTDSVRVINAVSPGANAYVQVRAWDGAGGATYEAALAAGKATGASTVFTVTTGGGLAIPAALVGLRSFSLQLSSPPNISSQPAPVTVGLGGTARFEVTAGGPGPFTYQWRRNTVALPNATSRILEIRNVTSTDAGSYTVVVRNAFGEVISAAATLTIAPLPVIAATRIQPNPPLVGQALRLEVTVTGTGPFTYQWQLNGTDLPGATASLLNLASANSGTYAIRVTGPGGTVRQDITTVSAQYVLEIVAETGGTVAAIPSAATYAAGTTVTLTATPASGFAFHGWSGDLTGTANPSTVVMNGHRRVEAQFAPTGGTVYFSNHQLGIGLDAPVFDSDGSTRLSGTAFLAQLYAGPTPQSLAPIGEPEAFRTGDAAGYLVGTLQVIPNVAPGQIAHAQIRAWQASAGPTYEAATAAGGKRGASVMVSVKTGNEGTPPTLPAFLVGLQSFQLGTAPPPTIASVSISPNPPVQGAALRLEVVAAGTGPFQYAWLLNNVAIPGATTAILNLPAAAAGTYAVTVTGPGGTVRRDVTTVSSGFALELVATTGGRISAQPAASRYNPGVEVKLTAVPDAGYAFSGWAGDLSGSANPSSIVMSANRRVEALFQPTGGTVLFANRYGGQVDAPIFDTDGTTRLQGDAFRAQLYAGTTASTLIPVGAPSAFRTGEGAGYFETRDFSLPNVPPGGLAHVQVRVWAVAAGATYEQAEAAAGKRGASQILAITTGNAGSPPTLPAPLAGLESFRLVTGTPPLITQVNISPQPPVQGQPLRMEIVAQGTAPLQYRWHLNNADVPGAASAVLEVAAASPGVYAVTVSGPGGSVRREVATVNSGFALELAVSTGGRVQPEPSTPTHPPGTVVTLTAVADPGYLFSGWAGDLTGSANPSSIVMSANRRVEALFRPTGGTVVLGNRHGGQVDAPIFDTDGTTRLQGDAFVAQLYAGPTPSTLTPVGGAVAFRTGEGAGYFPSQERSIPNVSPGSIAHAQVRAWAIAAGATYELAASSGGKHGTSQILPVTTGNAGNPPTLPAPLLGLTSFRLVIGRPPVLVTPPAPVAVVAGQPVEFVVVATGDPVLKYQWRKDGTDLPGATSDRFSFASVIPAFAGKYSVRVSNASGSVESDPVDLTVLTPPSVTVLSPPAPLEPGEAANLLASGTGSPPLAYQWYQGQSGDTSKPVGNGTQNFQSEPLFATTTFWVRVTNPAGHANSATITVVVNLKAQTITFQAPAPVPFGTAPVALAATASSGLPVTFSLLSGPGTLAGNTVSITGAGTIRIRASQPGNATFQPAPPVEQDLVVQPAPATVTLSGLATVYNGAPKPVTAVTAPPGLAVALTYNGAPEAPRNAGNYPVVARVTDPNYAGEASGTLVIEKAPATFAFSRLRQVADGQPRQPDIIVTPAGLAFEVTYNGSTTPPTAAGVFAVRATILDPNHRGEGSAQFEVLGSGNLTGLVFLDANGDGIQNAGETGIPGVTVRVLALDATSELASTTSGASGEFAFQSLAAGSYYVQETQPAGYVSTTPDLRLVSVTPGTPTQVAFGEQLESSLGGTVFADLNGNGQQDAGETGIAGVSIRLEGATGQLTRTTGVNGSFQFSNVQPGSYRVEETDPAGYTSTTPNSMAVQLAAGASVQVNFGDQAAATVSGFVFEDRDGNGTRDTGEAGLAAVSLRLVGNAGQWTTETDDSGLFVFRNLEPGSYQLEETDPVGYVSTTPNLRALALASGGAAAANFGDQPAGFVAGVVYEDLNGNAQRDAGEPGLTGVTITLTGPDGQRRTLTDSEGAFVFGNVQPETYTVEEIDPTGFSSTTPNQRTVAVASGGSGSASFGDQASGTIAGEVFADLNGSGGRDTGEPGISGVTIRLQGPDGARSTTTFGDGSYQFTGLTPGSYTVEEIDPPSHVSTTPNLRALSLTSGGAASASFGDQEVRTISGSVFEDLNGNGRMDAGEPGIGGVELQLLRADDDSLVAETQTSSGGQFAFRDVPAGDYRVRQTILAQYTVLTNGGSLPALPALHNDPPPQEFLEKSVRLDEGGAASVTFANNVSGQLSGSIFDDLDGDGAQDTGEPGLGGVSVEVQHPDTAAVVASALTSGNGIYQVASLPAGTYRVVQSAVTGYTTAQPALSITLPQGGAAVANFANRAAGTVAGRVFNDEDGDGIADATEPGMGGVRVTLLASSGTTRDGVTSGNGAFLFTQVAAGSYTVRQEAPSGFTTTTPDSVRVTLQAGGSASATFGNRSPSVTPPSFTGEPLDLTLAEGESGTLSATVIGTAPIEYQWLKDGVALPGATIASVSITSATAAHAGLYQLRARNPVGFALSRPARVIVTSSDPFQSWIATHAFPAGSRNPGDDPDLDGLPNLIEFALGTSPTDAGDTGLPSVVLVAQGQDRLLGFELRRVRAAAGVRFALQASEDLVTWVETPSQTVVQQSGLDSDLVRVLGSVPVGSVGHRFLRLGAASASQPATPARLLMLSASSGSTAARLSVTGQAGAAYAIEWSSDLRTWNPLQTIVAGSEPVIVIDTSSTGVGFRMYRAVAR